VAWSKARQATIFPKILVIFQARVSCAQHNLSECRSWGQKKKTRRYSYPSILQGCFNACAPNCTKGWNGYARATTAADAMQCQLSSWNRMSLCTWQI
jgi:hypothetical protein